MQKIVLILAVLFSCGCATTMSATQRGTHTKKIYDERFDKVFSSTLNAFRNNGYSIEYIDEKNGIINTGSKSINLFLMQQKINASIQKISESRTAVQLFLTVDDRENQNFSDYRKMFEHIEKEMNL